MDVDPRGQFQGAQQLLRLLHTVEVLLRGGELSLEMRPVHGCSLCHPGWTREPPAAVRDMVWGVV